MSRALREVLPPIYQHLVGGVFDQPEVVEERATCNDCAMCDKGQGSPVAMEFFLPDAKCCTFHPHLPNYLVGAILADESPEMQEGRRRIRAKIAARIGVTPLHIVPPRKRNLLATASQNAGVFGRTKVLLCPYFAEETANCTIWRHRETVCTTFFCKYSAGSHGWEFWNALKEYLGFVEACLATQAMKMIDPALTEPKIPKGELTFEDLEDAPPRPPTYATYWGSWVGREEAFYVACHELVTKLKREDFVRHIDESPKGRSLLDEVAERYRQLTPKELPKYLIRNPWMKTQEVGDAVIVVSYNRNDSYSVDKDLFEVLGMLNARETLADNLARLDREHGIELAPELLTHLVLHGVLVPPAQPARGYCATSD